MEMKRAEKMLTPKETARPDIQIVRKLKLILLRILQRFRSAGQDTKQSSRVELKTKNERRYKMVVSVDGPVRPRIVVSLELKDLTGVELIQHLLLKLQHTFLPPAQ